jgi:hypothetical protein
MRVLQKHSVKMLLLDLDPVVIALTRADADGMLRTELRLAAAALLAAAAAMPLVSGSRPARGRLAAGSRPVPLT